MKLGTFAVTAVLALGAVPAALGQGADYTQWRGANRDGISAETGLLKDWPANGPPLAWQTTGAGAGFSSFSTSGGRLYTIGARDDVEYVMAFDRATQCLGPDLAGSVDIDVGHVGPGKHAGQRREIGAEIDLPLLLHRRGAHRPSTPVKSRSRATKIEMLVAALTLSVGRT